MIGYIIADAAVWSINVITSEFDQSKGGMLYLL